MKKNVIVPNVGDVIEVVLHHYKPEIVFQTKVTKIRTRLGKVNDGKIPQSPLITCDNKEHQYFDASYITKIISQSKFPKVKENIFKSVNHRSFETKNKKIICGPITHLVESYLSTLDEEIICSISDVKLKRKLKSLTGIKDFYRGIIITVKKDHFKKWISKNWRSILYTKKELSEKITARIKREEEDYWNSAEQELHEEFEILIKRFY